MKAGDSSASVLKLREFVRNCVQVSASVAGEQTPPALRDKQESLQGQRRILARSAFSMPQLADVAKR